jgi:hypothetical protein
MAMITQANKHYSNSYFYLISSDKEHSTIYDCQSSFSSFPTASSSPRSYLQDQESNNNTKTDVVEEERGTKE